MIGRYSGGGVNEPLPGTVEPPGIGLPKDGMLEPGLLSGGLPSAGRVSAGAELMIVPPTGPERVGGGEIVVPG